MLKVTFEIIPNGNPEHKNRREIGSMEISLDEMSHNIGTYTSTMYTDGYHEPAARIVHINHYDRAKGGFLLVSALLNHHLRPTEGVLGPSKARKRQANLGDLLALQTAPVGKETPLAVLGRPLSDSLVDISHEARAILTVWETAQFETANLAVKNGDTLTAKYTRPRCAACGNQEGLTGQEYSYDSPMHYDGVSEYHCPCGARTGRWSNRILQPGEVERPFGY